MNAQAQALAKTPTGVQGLDHITGGGVPKGRCRLVRGGAAHSADEVPFPIDAKGVSVPPVTSRALNHKASNERAPTGGAGLVDMLGGQGFWRGSSIFVSGAAGPGKSILSAHFVAAACDSDGEGRRGLFIVKARGIAHSSAVRPFAITSQGLQRLEPRAGAGA